MKHALSLRLRRALAVACGLGGLPAPARADPISITVLAFLGTQTATALAIAVTTFVLTTAASLVVSFAMQSLFSPKNNAQDRQASVATLDIGENPREALFGTVGTGGTLDDAFNYGGTNGTDWEVLIITVADHRCHSLVGFYVGDTYVPFVANGAVAGYSGQLEVYWLPGTEAQVMPSVVTTYGGWDANSNLAGCATVVVAYKADKPYAKNPVWTAGRPSFLWVVKGKLCYIARKDSSVGGTGTHRWNDPSTWEWTDNLIDFRYNWVRGIYACDRVDQPGMLLVGRGLTDVEAPPDRTFAYANTCDELVPLRAGGSERRYRCNLAIKTSDAYIDTEEMFAAACAGIIIQRLGGVEVEPGSARSVVAEITDDDLIVGEAKTFNAFKPDSERINTVIPRYVEPSQKWADHAAPVRRILADLIEDGGPYEDTVTLTAVTSGTQAQRCGEIKRRQARLEKSSTLTLGPRFARLEDGDWIGWTSAKHFAGERVVFRISNYALAETWRNTIAPAEIAADCFEWDAPVDELVPGAVAQQQARPPRDAPSSSEWSMAGTSLTGPSGESIPAIVFAGSVATSYVDQVIFEYRIAGGDDADWIDGAVAAPNVQRREIAVRPNTQYDGAVSYVIGGVPTERLVIEAESSTGQIGSARGAHAIQPGTQTVTYPVTSTAHEIDIAPFSAVIDSGQAINFPTGSVTGLTAASAYVVLWNRSTSAYEVKPYPASTAMADPSYVFIVNQNTLNADGTAPPGDSPPPGYGGGGLGCPIETAKVLLADADHMGPGEAIAIGDLRPGMWVWSPHEVTGLWSAWRVTRRWRFPSRLYAIEGRPETSGSHLWSRDALDPRSGFERAVTIAHDTHQTGHVIGVEIADAHTYTIVLDDGGWWVSHNKLAEPSD